MKITPNSIIILLLQYQTKKTIVECDKSEEVPSENSEDDSDEEMAPWIR